MKIHVYIHEPKKQSKSYLIGVGLFYFYLGYKFVGVCAKIVRKLEEEKGTK